MCDFVSSGDLGDVKEEPAQEGEGGSCGDDALVGPDLRDAFKGPVDPYQTDELDFMSPDLLMAPWDLTFPSPSAEDLAPLGDGGSWGISSPGRSPLNLSPFGSPERSPARSGSPVGSERMAMDDQGEGEGEGDDNEELSSLQRSLANLSPDLQRRLVETLVSIGSGSGEVPPQQQEQQAALPAAASAPRVVPQAKGKPQRQQHPAPASQSQSPPAPPAPIALPLASAAIGAFLTQYAHSHMAHSCSSGVPKAAQPQSRSKEIRTQG
jgi:hypothetical protein